MADYRYVPKEKQRPYDRDTGSGFDVSSFVDKNKRTIKITLGIFGLFLLLYFVGSSITGNMFLSEQDKIMTANSDFPRLSKFDANKAYYLCGNDIAIAKEQRDNFQSNLAATSLNLDTCTTQKTALQANFDTTTASLSVCITNLTTCMEDNVELQNHLDLAEAERDQFSDDLDELEDDYYDLAQTFADRKCCEPDENGTYMYVSFKIKNDNVYCRDEDDKVYGNDLNC